MNHDKVHGSPGRLRNPERFEVIALCDLDETKIKQTAADLNISPALYTDAERILADTRPDVFCFSTQPDVRLSMVELAAKYSVKGLAFEKPMASSLAEAERITWLCGDHGIKAVVSHQQKYLTSLQKVKELVDSGDIGNALQITAGCQPWLAQLGTHYMDYVLWANGGSRAKWVVGHVHGKELPADSHSSPNFTIGHMEFEKGVRAVVEFGKLTASHMTAEKFWVDNRLTVYGTHGYVWGDTDGRRGAQERTRLQPFSRRIWPTGWTKIPEGTRAILRSAIMVTKSWRDCVSVPWTTDALIYLSIHLVLSTFLPGCAVNYPIVPNVNKRRNLTMSRFIFSCITCALRAPGKDELLETLKHGPAAGFDYRGVAGPLFWSAGIPQWVDADKINRLAAEAGLLGMTDVCASAIPTGTSQAALSYLENSLIHSCELAERLNCPLVVFSGGWRDEEGTAGLEASVAGLKALLPMIEQMKVRIAL